MDNLMKPAPYFLGLLLACSTAWGQPDSPPDAPNFLSVVRRYADTMLDKGRDQFGPQKSGLFLSALDRATLAPLTVRPSPPAGIRRGDRPGRAWSAMTGANPMLDQNLLRVLYTLSDLTGDPRYARAADEALTWFFTHTMSPLTSLLPWGEHMSWDVILDRPISGGTEPIHEFARPWVLWDRCFDIAPKASRQFALGLWHHQIADHQSGAFDRHAPYFEHGPRDGRDFPRHGAFYIGTWCHAWKYTRDETFLEAIQAILQRFVKKRTQPDGSQAATLGPLDLELASRMVPEPWAGRLKQFAAEEDTLILPGLRQQLETGSVPKWQTGYSAGTLASQGMFCLGRYQQTLNTDYRELLLDLARAYHGSRPEENVDAWPLSFAHAISLVAAAYRLTGETVHLEETRRLAAMAVTLFWQDNPLPRASLHTGHYETITGADSLALALLESHAVLKGLTNAIPTNTIDR
jgi:hypothetical protein